MAPNSVVNWFKNAWNRNVVSAGRLRLTEQFQTIRTFYPHQLDREKLSLILAMFRYLSEEYSPTLLPNTISSREIEMAKKDLEQSIREVKTFNHQYIEKGTMIPPFPGGGWKISFAEYFVDEKGRYIPYVMISDYFAEVSLLLSAILEKNLEDDGEIQHNVRQLGDTLLLHAKFGLSLCEDLERATE